MYKKILLLLLSPMLCTFSGATMTGCVPSFDFPFEFHFSCVCCKLI